MDGENDNVEVITSRGAKRTIGGVQYNLLCERRTKAEAEKVQAGLQEDGCKTSISRAHGVYSVWWTK